MSTIAPCGLPDAVTSLPADDLRKFCPDPQLIIDAGAGNGDFARDARLLWPDAEIVSFEPAERFNTTLNPMDQKHRVIRAAVGSGQFQFGSLNLTRGSESNSFLPYLENGPLATPHQPIGYQTVEIHTIDSYCDASQPVGLIKLDVQGYELEAIEGALKTIARDKPVIFAEVSFQKLYKDAPLMADIDRRMSELGYRREILYGSSMPDLWGDAIYVPDETGEPIRLNIGAGDTVIPGFTAIDRRFGTEAFPLNYPDNSVEEIRCVHMLEHLSFGDALKALKEWNRVLKPGGRLRVSVPDAPKVAGLIGKDPKWAFYMMGGQLDSDDFHKSAFDEERLAAYMDANGFGGIRHWTSPNTDMAAREDISLNLEGFKGEHGPPTEKQVKVRAAIGVPRIGWNDAWLSITEALRPHNIPVETHTGCFWGQNVTKAMERCIDDGIDWLLMLDYDSMILPMHVERLIEILSSREDIDAIASLQMRRGSETPLMGITGQREMEISPEPIEVHTAHFGLTLLRVECLKKMRKPWLHAIPDENGEWGDGRRDDDITFWDRWREAGNTIFVAPDVKIGHLELLVSEFDENYQPVHRHIGDWWNTHARKGHCTRSRKEI